MTHKEINYLETKSGNTEYSSVGVINTEYMHDIITNFLALDEKLDITAMETYFTQLSELNARFLKKTI